MIKAFNNDEDIHLQAASQVFNIPMEKVSKEERSKAKAVNFGIVYGISDYGLGEQIGVSRKQAKEYIEGYLEKYSGIKKFMDEIAEDAIKDGYVKTLYNRRRYIPEIKSNNYVVRQFGHRIAMNTPIQGTAADVIKIAMINVYKSFKKNNLKSKLILQVHDELLIEALEEEQEIVKKILKEEMENVIKMKVPLKADLSFGYNWYEAK
jgi:DNA polymerase-1